MTKTRINQPLLVKKWNDTHPAGRQVIYRRTLKDRDGYLAKTTGAALLLGGHTAVVKIQFDDGKTDTVAVEHLTPFGV